MVIDENWIKYRTFDFGLVNPWVCLYIAEDSLGRLYIYDEIYLRGVTTPEMIGKLTDSKHYEYNVADPAGASDREMLLQAGIPTLAPKSPSVTGGILFVKNALADKLDGKPGLLISSKCVNTIFEFEKGYHYPDNVITDVPIKENDHACFIAGTLISTNSGLKRIEYVNQYDKVLTRNGFRDVIYCQETGCKDTYLSLFNNGQYFISTVDHPVITLNGKKEIQNINNEQIYTLEYIKQNFIERNKICQNQLKWLNTMDLNLDVIQNQRIGQVESILLRQYMQNLKMQEDYMRKYGYHISDVFQRDMIYTIKTLIRQIMILQILNVYQRQDIKNYMLVLNVESVNHYLLKHWKWLNFGISQKRGGHFIESSELWVIKKQLMKSITALFAGLNLNQEICEKDIQNIVRQDVNNNYELQKERCMKFVNADIAVLSEKCKSVPRMRLAQLDVLMPFLNKQRVYNLSIDRDHEYFANGILVSNCDALRNWCLVKKQGGIRQSKGLY